MHVVLHFAHAATANYLVAGIPAAARAAHRVAQQYGVRGLRCAIAVPGGWAPSAWCAAELARLAPNLTPKIIDSAALEEASGIIHVCGETLVGEIGATIAGYARCLRAAETVAGLLADLRRTGDAIVAATGKPGDGIVSRHLNRPVSQAITRLVLRFPGVEPLHATLAAGCVGLIMAACLFLGGPSGLIVGAVLFQVASILDGVDGEIARATFRTSAKGALLDSLTDAATNLAFVAGVTFNLWRQGHEGPAALGAEGLAMLAAGLVVLGRRARARGGPFSFDALKDHFRARPSRVGQWLTWLTMRDFYAAAAAVLILVDLGPHLLIAFAMVTSGWFAVTLVVLYRNPAPAQTRPA